MATDMEPSGGCFGRLFGGGGDKKKQVIVDLRKNRSENRVESQSLITKTSGVSIRQTLHFSAIASHVNSNDGQPVHIMVQGVAGAIIQCAAPAAAAGVDHVAVDSASAEVMATTTVATVDVHQEEGHGTKKKRSSSSSSTSSKSSKSSKSSSSSRKGGGEEHEDPCFDRPSSPTFEPEPELVCGMELEPELVVPGVEPTSDVVDEEPACPGDEVVPQDAPEEYPAAVETESVDVVTEEVVSVEAEGAADAVVEDEEILVCEESQEVFSEPPMTLDTLEDVITFEEVVSVESTPDEVGEAAPATDVEVAESVEVVAAEGETSPEKKKKKKKTAEGEVGAEGGEKKKKKKKSESGDGEGGEEKKKKKKKSSSEGEEGGDGTTEKKKKKKKKSEGEAIAEDTILEETAEEVDDSSTAVVVEEESCEEPLENSEPTTTATETVVEDIAVVEETPVEAEPAVETTAAAEEEVTNGTIPITETAEILQEDLKKDEETWEEGSEDESSEDEIDPYFLK